MPTDGELGTSQPSSSPIPFFELTIPYLRQRNYTSQLGDLTPLTSTVKYASFLTSYTSDGLKINGLITKPAGQPPAGGWPAIVFIHGYIPPTQYRTQEKYVEYVNALASNGFVVFKIDLRGHGNSEGEASGAYYSSDYIIDTLNAYTALQSADFVDPNRIGLWGHSMAGNVIMRSVAVKPTIPAAVIWAGAVYSYQDFTQFGIQDNSYTPPGMTTQRQRRRQELFTTHGTFSPQSPFWFQVAPTNYLADFQTAIQIHHAQNDDVVKVEYSRNIAELLKQAGVSHEFFEYQSGGHNLTGSSFTTAMQRTVDFFKIHLR